MLHGISLPNLKFIFYILYFVKNELEMGEGSQVLTLVKFLTLSLPIFEYSELCVLRVNLHPNPYL